MQRLNPSRRPIFKAALFLHRGMGGDGGEGGSICGPAGQHRELHVAQLSMTTRARDGRGRVRERSPGAETQAQSRDFHFAFVCLLLSTDVSPSALLPIKDTHQHVDINGHTC